jgi:T-complex protein 1 subunit theta
VNTFKAISKDGRLIAGGGATEIELATKVSSYGETLPGMEQYAVQKYAEALQAVVAAIADNAGIKANDLVTLLLAAHQGGDKNAAIDITSDTPATLDALKHDLIDVYAGKYWGIKYATSTANTILQVDQIICAKQAGGPKPRQGGGDWDQD